MIRKSKTANRDSLGELEQLLMLAVVRLGSSAYGAEIQRELEDAVGRRLTISTIYVTLVRLEKKGLVRSHRSEPTATRGGKQKRVFRLTPRGVRALRHARNVLETMWEGVESSPDFKSFS
jgi:DNA-binding PadR family transcriptional regulator